MKRGEFISNILKRYSAFYREILSVKTGSNLPGKTFLWAYDTAFPNKPIFTVDDELYDYSGLLNININADNYKSFIEDAGITYYNINKLSKEHAEKIMENNIMAVLRLEKLLQKADTIKSIVEE